MFFSVFYCKPGYFRWGEISRKRHLTWGLIFTFLLVFFFIKACGFYFHVGVIFAKKTKARKTQKLPPCENFHVYSIGIGLVVVDCDLVFY